MGATLSPADASASATPEKVCVLCGEPFTEFGNNPWPLAELTEEEPPFDGRCCGMCNSNLVIPARLALLVDA